MKAIYKAPGKMPELVDIPNTLDALQEIVGGRIESLTYSNDAAVICNQDGAGLEYNTHFLGADFYGPIILVGVSGDEMIDFPAKNISICFYALRVLGENAE